MKLNVLSILLVFTGYALANDVEILWTYVPPAGYVDASPALGDLTGNGQDEIVLCTTAGITVALTAKQEEIWRYEMRGPITIPPSVGNVQGDDQIEVVVMNRQGQIHCLDGRTGVLLWTFDLPSRLDWGETALVLADIDGDSRLEIVTGDRAGNVVCLTGTGEQRWMYKGDHGSTYAPIVVDLDGDGYKEILIGGSDVPLVCLSFMGQILWRLDEGMGGSPLIYDIDHNKSPEILLGINENFTVLDARGSTLWSFPLKRTIDSAITIADADNDGDVEIYAIDLSGTFVSLTPQGKTRWSTTVEARARRSPSVGDVDGDGINEILVAGYSGALHVFEPDGRLQSRIPVPGGVNSTATLVRLEDGTPGVLIPVCNEAVRMLRFPGATKHAELLWREHRYDSHRNGPPMESVTNIPISIQADFGNLYAGPNLFTVTVMNPECRVLEVRLEASREAETPSLSVISSSMAQIENRLSYTVPSDVAINLSLQCTVSESGKILARKSHSAYLAPFAKELADSTRLTEEIADLLSRLPDRRGLEEHACVYAKEEATIRSLVQQSVGGSEEERLEIRNALHTLLESMKQLHRIASAAQEIIQNGYTTLYTCGANPWAPFGGFEELIERRFGEPVVTVDAFAGETESAAVNVFNLSGRARTFRVELSPLSNGKEFRPAHECLSLHEVINVPTELGDTSADALPLLNGGNLLQVPAWDARQLWITIVTKNLEPGTWSGYIRLKSLEAVPVETQHALAITVWPSRLPEKQPLSLCHWGYVHRSAIKDFPDAALIDQIVHGTNVFVGTFFPKATYDEQGNLVGSLDFEAHDAYVRSHAPHGKILFCGYQYALQGPGDFDSEAYGKAHIAWLRQWVAHLKELGIDYSGFALYPVDEPGLNDGLVEHYIRMAELAREADPKILMYTDPVGRITEDELRRMLPLVDIWCPNRNGLILDKNNTSKLDLILKSGKTVWMYECDGNAKHQSPLGYYRGQAWLAWHYGITGIGFWSYCTSEDDPWFRPGMRHDYLLVYPGQGVVSSKRWEAVRDGIEDYSMLWYLRKKTELADPNVSQDILAEAKALMTQEARMIAGYCGLDFDTLPGAEGPTGVRRIADTQWQKIRSVRQEIARLLQALPQ